MPTVLVDGVDVSHLGLVDLAAAMGVIARVRDGVAHEGIEAACKACFANYERLVSFSWRQYTPYFNDGDACTFSAHTDYLDDVLWLDEDGEELELEDVSEPWGTATEEPSTDPLVLAERAAVKALAPFFALAEAVDDDTFLAAYGDHVKVTARRGEDGEVTVAAEQADHD